MEIIIMTVLMIFIFLVVSSLRHPFPGWIDVLNGPSGLIVSTGKGLLHVMRANGPARSDMLPVDMAIDTLMAVAWEIAIDKPSNARVYNCSTYANPTTNARFGKAINKYLWDHPMKSALWYPFIFPVENRYVYKVLEMVLHTVPLNTLDYFIRLLGFKTTISLRKANEKMTAMNSAFLFFIMHEWKFCTDNVKRLQARLSPQDSEIYNLDPHSINWDKHYKDFVGGMRKYFLKEKDEDIKANLRHVRRLYYLHCCTILVGFLLFLRAITTKGLDSGNDQAHIDMAKPPQTKVKKICTYRYRKFTYLIK